MLTVKEHKTLNNMLDMMRSPVTVGGVDTLYITDVKALLDNFVVEGSAPAPTKKGKKH